ncbi:hypothetical protein [Pseudomonas sp. A34-9]|uniref:hypothetical protein n=1 Tax=Pseudomonas sp. A34-9 TaxID=3034675 RepID=UPI00240DB446|nr:hypothetical protein [Pseudomonas sp. A34-9]
MAKPPKIVAVTHAPDTSTTTTRTGRALLGHRGTGHLPDLPVHGVDMLSGLLATDVSQGSVPRAPSVTVSRMPSDVFDTYTPARSEIAWPQSRFNELIPIGDNTGLFTGPDLRTYAQIGTEGRFVVEQNPQGNYFVPLSFAPGVPGPVLAKIQGQASWRIERPGWQSTEASLPVDIAPQPPAYLSPEQAGSLTRAELSADGIRYDKHKKTYVDMAEGTVMIGKHKGVYRETSAGDSSPNGMEVENIPGTKVWRRKVQDTSLQESPPPERPHLHAAPDDPTPGPSKRPRLDAPEARLTLTPDSAASVTRTPYFWLPWGHLNPPPSGDSVLLGWLHYPIVPIGSAPHRLPQVYFLQHPEFVPARFDAFEHMLQTTPELQPVATFRIGTEPGEVHPGKRFFEKPLSQSVTDTFPAFSDLTSRAVARKLFELADNSTTITGTGLVNIQAVLHQWNQKPFPTTPAYADPMNMLPITTPIDVGGKRLFPWSAQLDGDLQRLTFDPKRFPLEWHHYLAAPTDLNLRRLVGALLVRSGYDVFPLTHEHNMPTLVFRRTHHEEVFFLKLGDPGLSHTPGNELVDPALPRRIGDDALLALTTAKARNKVVWLIGGVVKVKSNPEFVVIIRER